MDDRQDIEKDALEAIRINRRKKGGETGYIKGNASKSRRILDGPSPFGRKRGNRDRGKAHESLLWTLHFYYSTVINIKLFPTILAWAERLRHRVTKKRQCVTERAWFSGGKYALMKIRSSGGRRRSIPRKISSICVYNPLYQYPLFRSYKHIYLTYSFNEDIESENFGSEEF